MPMKLLKDSNINLEKWNKFVAQWPDFELMQSYEWGTFKKALGWKVIRLAIDQDGRLVAGVQMLLKPLFKGLLSIAYVPRGPLLSWDDGTATNTLLSAMHASARQHRAISLKIEPAIRYPTAVQQQLQDCGFQPSKFTNQPQCSMLIDLSPDPGTILAKMDKTTRYNIRYSARKGVTVREATINDLDDFHRMLEFTAKRARFPVRPRAYYRREWETFHSQGQLKLLLAFYDGELLAARMPAIFGNKAATFHSASYDTHRNLKPNELLMWESIEWAKSNGCTTYDVWGIPNEIGEHHYENKPLPKEQTGGLWGVYRFKRGFGGDLVYYIGAYDYIYSPSLYRLMNATISRLGSLDRFARLGDFLDLSADQSVGT